MPIQDSIYTNPDALRLLYLAPKNPLKDLDEDSRSGADNAPFVPVVSGPVGGPIRPPLIPCPAVGQYTAALLENTRNALKPVLVEELRLNEDMLWDAISRTFKKVVAKTIVHDVDGVRYRTNDGAESIVSIWDFIIRDFEDETGQMIGDILREPDAIHGNVSVIDFIARESNIAWVEDVGKISVVKITLEGEQGGRYASGTDPLKMTMRHNRKDDEGDILIE